MPNQDSAGYMMQAKSHLDAQHLLLSIPTWRKTLLLFAALVVFAFFPLLGRSSIAEEKLSMQKEQSAEVTVKAKFNYLIYLPNDYEQKDSHPLMLFLHGAGERGDNQLELVQVHGPPKLIAQGRSFPCVVVSPQCPLHRWWDAAELSALLDHVEANYKIDKRRIYVTGLSMGGYGTWSLALREPDRFAAIAPICGGGNDLSIKFVDKISAPIWAFHGAKDKVIPVDRLHAMQSAHQAEGIDMKVTIYPQVGHDAWNNAYADEKLYEWMFAQQRD